MRMRRINTYTPELPNLSWVMSLKVNSFNTSKNCRLVGGSSSCFSFWTEVSPFLRLYMIPSLQNMARKGCQLINGQPPPVVLLYEVVITFESLDEISERYHSHEIYRAVLSCVLFIMPYKVKGLFIMEVTQHYMVTKIPTDVRLQRILVLVISQCQHQLREQIYGQGPAKTNKTNKPNSV